MKNDVIEAYKQYLDLNLIHDSQESYADFAITRCTACGDMKDLSAGKCRSCNGEGGLCYQDIPPV